MSKMDDILQRISRFLMLHGSSVSNLGLLNGKMGICIFFYRYSQITRTKYYSDFADEIIDEIYKEITTTSPTNFCDGLSGISWGIEFIVRNNFVKADTDDILEDLDKQVVERDIRKIDDISLETGLEGLAHYVISRRINKTTNNRYITKEYILELTKGLQKNNINEKLIINLVGLTEDKPIEYSFDLLDGIVNKNKVRKSKIFDGGKVGIIDNGITGYAMKLLNERL